MRLKHIVALSVGLAVVGAMLAEPAAAQNPPIYYGSRTSLVNAQPRYRRGEHVVVRGRVNAYTQVYRNGFWRQIDLGPARNVTVYFSEKSAAGTWRMLHMQTDAHGIAQFRYQVPLDPRKDYVSVCAWTWNEEPFEGTEVRIPIG
jgi:hypothetical protein